MKRVSGPLCRVTVQSEIYMLFRQLLNSYRLAPRRFPSCTEVRSGWRTRFRRQNLPEITKVYVWLPPPPIPCSVEEGKAFVEHSVPAYFFFSGPESHFRFSASLKLPETGNTSHSPLNYHADLRFVELEHKGFSRFCVRNESKHTRGCTQIA